MKRFKTIHAILATLILSAAACAHAQTALRIIFIDVEGGQATLFIAPTGQSLLIDTGWSGANNRDAGRIVAAAHSAGLSKIDTVLITHYHTDHVGGVPQLAAMIPIGRFLDHGPNREFDHGVTEQGYVAYQLVLADRNIPHQTVKPGDLITGLPGVKIKVVSGDGKVISIPAGLDNLPANAKIPPGPLNPFCAASPEKPAENSENDDSLGLVLTFGKTRILDLGDLTWNRERPLMCPIDQLGKIDVYIASHHGFDRSGSPALVNAIAPRIAIMENGGHKGADANAWTIVEQSPRLKDLWQLHTAEASGSHNVDPSRIANLSPAAGGPPKDAGNALEFTIQPNGSFSMKNDRTGQSVTYPAP